MKILKIFGIVVGIHVFALILIFANPGCSSSTKPAPQPTDTVPSAEAGPAVTVPTASSTVTPTDLSSPAVTPAANGFNPDAPATYASGSSGSGPAVRFSPIRPNTPAATAVVTQPVQNVVPATTYTVKAGDSLWVVAKRHHVTVKELATTNNLPTNTTIHQGQKLLIPGKVTSGSTGATEKSSQAATSTSPKLGTNTATSSGGAATTSSSAGRPTNDEFKYTVKSGETLGTIARKFDVRTRDLAVHNNITDPKNLRAGTELSIPGWQATSGGSSKTSGRSGSSSGSAAKAQTPASSEPKQVPNILEPVPSQPASTPSSTVPVINIDDPITPAPKS